MGLCNSKPSASPSTSSPKSDHEPDKEISFPASNSVVPAKDSTKTTSSSANGESQNPTGEQNGKKSPFFPFYSPSPAHYLFSKKSPARSPANVSSNSTPRRFFRRPFPPPSPAKHIKAALARRHGSVKPNEASIPEGSEAERVTGLDKSFGFSKHFGSKYELGDEVGRGHFGYTCAAKFKKGELKGQQVAVKVIPKAKMTTAIAIEDVRREVKILRALTGHNNLVQFYDAYEDHDNVYIVMELCEGGELLDRILSRGGKYSEDDAKAVMTQILNVVAFCHLQGVVHRDLKPENFLFMSKDENSQLKAIDFGLSDFVKPDERLNDIVGSAYYVAPEVLHRSYSTEADVWSIGVISYILLCGSRPFWARTESGIFRAVLKADPSFEEPPWPSLSAEAKDFVKRLLNKDPRKRMTAAQALSHPWIKNSNDAKVPLDILIFKLMKAYMRSSSLRKAALKALSKTLTVDELFYLKEQYALLEPSKSGTISLENIKVALMKNSTDAMKESRVPDFLASLNALQYRRMDFEEFCAAALSVHQLEVSDEPERKRPHLNSVSSAMARNSTPSSPNNKSVDAAVLQNENQKLLQQIDIKKHELHDLEARIKDLRDKQSSYDDMLIVVNQLWNQLVDDLILLGVRAGAGRIALEFLDQADHSLGSVPSCPAEEMFLCRLLERDSIEANGNDEIIKYVEEALAQRHSSTIKLLKLLEDTLDDQRAKTENIAQALHGKLSSEDAIIQLSKIDDMMKEEAIKLREVIAILHLKHKEYVERIQNYINSHSVDECEIKRLAGELDESMAELEESRRKLINLKMQKDVASVMHTPTQATANGNLSPEKFADRMKGLRELKDSIEEAKILAEDRLSELQDAQEENLILSKQLQDIQNELNDDKYVCSSRLYSLLNDQLQHWNTEVDRYKVLTDSLQADRPLVVRREKELIAKLESADAVRNAINNAESRIEELELQLQKCVIDKNDLEIKMEEALQDAGRNDIKSEFHVMASALSKEIGMMEAQLKRWKETAHEALSLREQAQSLKAQLNRKTNEKQSLADKCAEQMMEIKSLKALIEVLQKEKLELQIFLDMYGQESYDSRELMEIKESERRAHSQAEVLRNALDEHSLELRVKAANEAEAACQQRLSAAEAEIADLRAKLDASERDVLELTEAIRSKDGEAEQYISEIETIGQAYEDMQMQNQHLLQQVTERDDYNIKLVSESVKTKQVQSVLLSEKQALAKQLQQINASVESFKMKISYSEEQMEACLTEAIKSTQEERHLAVNLETAKWEWADAEKELKWLKSSYASSEKEYEQIQQDRDDLQNDLENDRSSRKKLEEELRELNSKFAEMSSETGEAAIQKLQDEIKSCKSILKCSVCSDRPKEVVIVKCYHLFCNPCIQKNLEIRHRKCPACGNAFGQNDVRFVKI